MNLANIRAQFGYLKNNPQEIYFDSSATFLKPLIVSRAEQFYYEHINANPHSFDYQNAYQSNQILSQTRKQVQTFINARSEQEVVFTSGASFGLNQIAFGLRDYLNPGDEIFVSDLEHSSNLVPWLVLAQEKQLVIKEIPLTETFAIDIDQLSKMITPKTKVVSFAVMSNTIGISNDVKKITTAIKQVNVQTLVCVDGAQSVGHQKTDVQAWGVDFFTFSAHKMYGPFGVGVLYGNQNVLETLKPLVFGGGMSESVRVEPLKYQLTPLPVRLEAGTPNIAGIYAFSKALDFINEIGIETIHNHELKLKKYAQTKIKEANLNSELVFYNLENDAPMLLFNLKGVNPQDIASFLAHDYQISVRSGAMCARLTAELGFKISVRVSFGIYNTEKEIDKLVEGLKNIEHFLDHIL